MKCTKNNLKNRIIKMLFFLALLLAGVQTFAQNDIPEQVAESPIYGENDIHQDSEKRPEFPGGTQKFYEFVGKNYRVPNVKNINGKIIVQFVVEKDGTLSNIKVIRDIGLASAKEAIRILKRSPKWIPGEQDGKAVRVQFTLPISIRSN